MNNQGACATVVKLLETGFISLPVFLFTEYKRLGLSEIELLLIVQLMIYKEKEGIDFPTAAKLSERMQLKQNAIFDHLQSLVVKGFVRIEQGYDEAGLCCECYSLLPLKEQMAAALMEGEPKLTSSQKDAYARLFALVELEFGRTISPFETEILSKWLDEDKYSEGLIETALREAVLADKLNFRYIDRILLNWDRRGIKTKAEALEYSRSFRTSRTVEGRHDSAELCQEAHFTFYNWVTGE
ncbi:MAG: hypothetical protein RLZ12_105 [Bacillota bacterium]|jgi:DNA replication protein